MRILICALAASALTAGVALAGQAPVATDEAKAAAPAAKAPSRTVYICDESDLTRRAFAREFGSAQFVTAKEAAARGESWSAPKCITAAEARRLRQLASRER